MVCSFLCTFVFLFLGENLSSISVGNAMSKSNNNEQRASSANSSQACKFFVLRKSFHISIQH
jgi:hypothetical protein